MQAYKWLVAFLLLISIGVGGFSLAVGAATAPLAVPNEPATLHVESGRVDLKKANANDWTQATEGAVITPGDSLKTDSTGEASVNLFDQGEIRLDHDTEITLTDALWDANTPDVFLGSVFLSTGKLWSRLFDFVSPDSGFNVRTESTVATVRGTVFSVSALPDGGAWVYVDDHTVNVKTPTDSQALTNGQHAQIAKDGGRFAITRKDIPDEKFVDWIAKNRKKDFDFDARVRAKWRKKLSKIMAFARVAEPLRLAATLDAQQKEALKKRFGLRAKLLARLESVRHNDLPTAPAVIEPVITTTTVTTVGSIVINGLPGGTQTIPLNVDPIVIETAPTDAPPAPKPVSVAISTKVTSVAAGSQTSLVATLTYDDGHTEDVSKDVNWDVLPDEQGYVAGKMISNIFIAGERGGVACIRAIFTGSAARLMDSVYITVATPAGQTAPLY
jgi:hypothetical protein